MRHSIIMTLGMASVGVGLLGFADDHPAAHPSDMTVGFVSDAECGDPRLCQDAACSGPDAQDPKCPTCCFHVVSETLTNNLYCKEKDNVECELDSYVLCETRYQFDKNPNKDCNASSDCSTHHGAGTADSFLQGAQDCDNQ